MRVYTLPFAASRSISRLFWGRHVGHSPKAMDRLVVRVYIVAMEMQQQVVYKNLLVSAKKQKKPT